MVIYEMIYHSGPDDFEVGFYLKNSKKNREHFFEQIMSDVNKSLDDCKARCEDGDLLLKYLKNDMSALEQMKKQFIDTGKARFDSYVSICVAERTVRDF
ncbi:hypothetical protein [Acinetobacter rudis]|uniref:Uncharacterized protein n=1 Tax=Acinetobacter rudis CIP 110305 TaxID=421052 RepID=S3N594_9GAMM|nr:hypothetical protein [Acinetobacter rudis]EPF74992.1 hypothetical protein F945_01363 [Acinetobacter rudis CIP 110305]